MKKLALKVGAVVSLAVGASLVAGPLLASSSWCQKGVGNQGKKNDSCKPVLTRLYPDAPNGQPRYKISASGTCSLETSAKDDSCQNGGTRKRCVRGTAPTPVQKENGKCHPYYNTGTGGYGTVCILDGKPKPSGTRKRAICHTENQ